MIAIGASWLAPVQGASQPDWDDLVPGRWTVVSRNTIRDVDPCPMRRCSYSAVEGISGVIDDWNGGAFASRHGELGTLLVWGGGHNGYFGSEVYGFDLATGLWRRLSEPYDNGRDSVAGDCNDDGVYPDGSACPTHTYDQVEYDPESNRFVVVGGTPDPVCGGCVDDRVHLFELHTGRWILGARHPSGRLSYGGTTGYDPRRAAIWLLSGYTYAWARYDLRRDAWEEFRSPGVFEIDGAGLVDPERDIFLFIESRATRRLYAVDLTHPNEPFVVLRTEGDTEIQGRSALGFDREEPTGRFVAWDNGADVYVLQPPEGDWRTGAWRWTRVPPDPGNTVVPERNGNGTYSRFRYASTVNAFIVVSSVNGPVWAYRLSPGAGTGPMPSGDGGVSSRDGGVDPGERDGGGVEDGGEPGGRMDGSASTDAGTDAASRRRDGMADGSCVCRASGRWRLGSDGVVPGGVAAGLLGVTRRRRRGRRGRSRGHVGGPADVVASGGVGGTRGNAGGRVRVRRDVVTAVRSLQSGRAK
ncbi:MAG: hypothetical protein NZ898_06910 [Myxococcota bacterium]|nr:hypothetical protein [Myxococcota bacterium]